MQQCDGYSSARKLLLVLPRVVVQRVGSFQQVRLLNCAPLAGRVPGGHPTGHTPFGSLGVLGNLQPQSDFIFNHRPVIYDWRLPLWWSDRPYLAFFTYKNLLFLAFAVLRFKTTAAIPRLPRYEYCIIIGRAQFPKLFRDVLRARGNFERFPNLPYELFIFIWEYALPRLRIVEVSRSYDDNKGSSIVFFLHDSIASRCCVEGMR